MPASRRKVFYHFLQNEQAYGFDKNGRFFNPFLFFQNVNKDLVSHFSKDN